MAKKKAPKVAEVSKLEEQYAQLMNTARQLQGWLLPSQDSMSLEQPSPYRVVPMTTDNNSGGDELMNATRQLPGWLPLPDSMSLEQPSPYRVVPMKTDNNSGGDDHAETRQ